MDDFYTSHPFFYERILRYVRLCVKEKIVT